MEATFIRGTKSANADCGITLQEREGQDGRKLLIITKVDGLARKSGQVFENDVLTHVNGKPVANMTNKDAKKLFKEAGCDSIVKITVEPADQTRSLAIATAIAMGFHDASGEKEANEKFDEISKAFFLFDTKGTGALDLVSTRRALHSLGMSLTEKKVQGLMLTVAKNVSSVTLNEFRSAVLDMRSNDSTVLTMLLPQDLRKQYKHRLGLRCACHASTAREIACQLATLISHTLVSPRLTDISGLHHSGSLPWIERVGKDSLARECGLCMGDVVIAIDGEPVFDKSIARRTFNRAALKQKNKAGAIVIKVLRTMCRIQVGDQLLAINGQAVTGRDETQLKLREARGLTILTIQRGENVYETWIGKPTRRSSMEMPPTGVKLELHNFDTRSPPDIVGFEEEHLQRNKLPLLVEESPMKASALKETTVDEMVAEAMTKEIEHVEDSAVQKQIDFDDVSDQREAAAVVVQSVVRGRSARSIATATAPVSAPAAITPAAVALDIAGVAPIPLVDADPVAVAAPQADPVIAPVIAPVAATPVATPVAGGLFAGITSFFGGQEEEKQEAEKQEAAAVAIQKTMRRRSTFKAEQAVAAAPATEAADVTEATTVATSPVLATPASSGGLFASMQGFFSGRDDAWQHDRTGQPSNRPAAGNRTRARWPPSAPPSPPSAPMQSEPNEAEPAAAEGFVQQASTTATADATASAAAPALAAPDAAPTAVASEGFGGLFANMANIFAVPIAPAVAAPAAEGVYAPVAAVPAAVVEDHAPDTTSGAVLQEGAPAELSATAPTPASSKLGKKRFSFISSARTNEPEKEPVEGQVASGKASGISRMRNRIRAYRSKAMDDSHTHLEFRVRHKDRVANAKGDCTDRVYRLVMRVIPDPQKKGVNVKMLNSRFMQRDEPKFVSRMLWMVSLLKLIVFYCAICGLLQMPSKGAMKVAMRLLALPAVCLLGANIIGDTYKAWEHLAFMLTVSRAIGIKRTLQVVRFVNSIKSMHKMGAPTVRLPTVMEVLTKAHREKVEIDDWPELVLLGLMHEMELRIGDACTANDATRMVKHFMKPLLGKDKRKKPEKDIKKRANVKI